MSECSIRKTCKFPELRSDKIIRRVSPSQRRENGDIFLFCFYDLKLSSFVENCSIVPANAWLQLDGVTCSLRSLLLNDCFNWKPSIHRLSLWGRHGVTKSLSLNATTRIIESVQQFSTVRDSVRTFPTLSVILLELMMMMMRRGAEIKGQSSIQSRTKTIRRNYEFMFFNFPFGSVCGGSEFMYWTSTGASERPPLEATRRQQQQIRREWSDYRALS